MDRTANELGLHDRQDSRSADFALSGQYAPTEINNELMANEGLRQLDDTDGAGRQPAGLTKRTHGTVARPHVRSAHFDQAIDACVLLDNTRSTIAGYDEDGVG